MIGYIDKHPENILKSFSVAEITFLKQTLHLSGEQILFRYGKGKINDKGLQEFTDNQVLQSMPLSTKKLFWSVNNASRLINITLRLNEDLADDVKRMRAELTSYQMQILELQNKLNNK